MKAQVLHAQERVLVDAGSHPGLEAPRDVVVRISRRGLRGADLHVHASARDAHDRRRAARVVVVAAPCAGVIALTRIVEKARFDRETTPLRALLDDASLAREALALDRWIDALRDHDRLDDLMEWLVRARPRADELVREGLARAETVSVARSPRGYARFGAVHAPSA